MFMIPLLKDEPHTKEVRNVFDKSTQGQTARSSELKCS